MTWKGWTLAGLVAVAGCSFESSDGGQNSAGLGEDSESDTDASASSPTTDDSTTGASGTGTSASDSNPTSTSDPTSASDPTMDPTTTPETTGPTTGTPETSDTGSTSASTLGPSIEFEGEDFGVLDFQNPATRDFQVTNTGDETATTFELSTSGAFEVESTDCPAMLDPEASCGVRLRHAADALGPFSGALEAVYDGGMADTALSADVRGSTANLVTDGGFETCPDGPWQNVGAGQWLCNASFVSPHSGSGYLAGDTGPDNQLYDYRLDVDVTPYANAIATGNMSFEFRAWGRSYDVDNEPYRMRVRYRDGGGQILTGFNTNLQTSTTWTEHTDTRNAPSDTEEIRIDLYCEKSQGTYCDAYYDDVVLVGTYDGP